MKSVTPNIQSFFSIPFEELEINNMEELGRGLSGLVCPAKWNGFPVAVKKMHFLKGDWAKTFNEHQKEGFLSEAERMSRFRHPNIAEFYGVSHEKENDFYLFVMKREGGDLRNRILSKQPLSMENKLRVSLCVSRGLQYLQSKGKVHRDLRPANILLCLDYENGQVVMKAKICDFGLTRGLDAITNMHQGVSFYIAPENKIDEKKQPTFNSDIFSLGMCLWCVFSFNLPDKLCHEDQIFEREYDQGCVRGVMLQIAKKCCSRDQQSRCKIEDIISTLEELLGEEKTKNEELRIQTEIEEERKREEAEKKLSDLEKKVTELTKKEEEDAREKNELLQKIGGLEKELEEKDKEFETERIDVKKTWKRRLGTIREAKLEAEDEKAISAARVLELEREVMGLRSSKKDELEQLKKEMKEIAAAKEEELEKEIETLKVTAADVHKEWEEKLKMVEAEKSAVTAREVEEEPNTIEALSVKIDELQTKKKRLEMLKMAHDCLYGLNGERIDYYKPHKLYKEIVNSGGKLDANANFNLGHMYFGGYGVKEDGTKSKEYYKNAAEFYSSKKVEDLKPNDWKNMGLMYVNGHGFEQNQKKGAELLKKAVERGNVVAMWYLGACFQLGHGVEKSYSEAFKLHSKAAEMGLPSAMNSLAYMYDNGYGVNKDEKKAFELFREAAEKGCRAAMYNVGECYRDAEGVEENIEEAKKWYKLAADLGDEEAEEEWKKLCPDAKSEPESEIAREVETLELSPPDPLVVEEEPNTSEESSAKIDQLKKRLEMLEMAHNIFWGLKGERMDYYKPHKLYKEIVNSGGELDVNANFNLGRMYLKGYGVKKDKTKSQEYYKNAAEFYSSKKVDDLKPNDWKNMGFMYVFGEGFEENEKKGIKLLKTAVERGSVLAMFHLGNCCHFGFGVKKSNSEAVKLYSKAAEMGVPDAMFNLGFMYSNGYGVDKDKKKAFELFREAAEKGVREAMYNVGYFYENGFGGVGKNLEEAKKWFIMAADLGDEDARKALEKTEQP